MTFRDCCQEMFLFVLINTLTIGACIFLSILNIVIDSTKLANDSDDVFSILMIIANSIYLNYSLLFVYNVIWKNKIRLFKIVSTIHFVVWIIILVMLCMEFDNLEDKDQVRFLLTASFFSLSNMLGIHFVCFN